MRHAQPSMARIYLPSGSLITTPSRNTAMISTSPGRSFTSGVSGVGGGGGHMQQSCEGERQRRRERRRSRPALHKSWTRRSLTREAERHKTVHTQRLRARLDSKRRHPFKYAAAARNQNQDPIKKIPIKSNLSFPATHTQPAAQPLHPCGCRCPYDICT